MGAIREKFFSFSELVQMFYQDEKELKTFVGQKNKARVESANITPHNFKL